MYLSHDFHYLLLLQSHSHSLNADATDSVPTAEVIPGSEKVATAEVSSVEVTHYLTQLLLNHHS